MTRVFLAILAAALLVAPAHARPRHHHKMTATSYAAQPCPDDSGRWCAASEMRTRAAATGGRASRSYGRRVRVDSTGCRVYLGCGCHLAVELGVDNPGHILDSARRWLGVGERARHGCTGCVAVLSRGGGGHVGVVRGYDAHGNPSIYSWGNRRVGWFTKTYPRRRVLGYRRVGGWSVAGL